MLGCLGGCLALGMAYCNCIENNEYPPKTTAVTDSENKRSLSVIIMILVIIIMQFLCE